MHAVLLAAQAVTSPEVAHWLGDSARAVEYWLHRLETQGLARASRRGATGARDPFERRAAEAGERDTLGSRASFGTANHCRRTWSARSAYIWARGSANACLASSDCPLCRPRLLIAHANDDGAEFGSVDEARFQQHGSRSSLWVPQENRKPVLLHHPTPQSLGYVGPARFRNGRFLYRHETEPFGVETFWAFLCYFHRTQRAAQRYLMLLLDNASHYHARLHQPWPQNHAGGLSLEFLPRYSSELNPRSGSANSPVAAAFTTGISRNRNASWRRSRPV